MRDAAPWAVMAAYNGVNGAHDDRDTRCCATSLKDEWGFDGVVMSDWFAARSTEAAGRAALDLAMPGPDWSVGRRAGRGGTRRARSTRRRSTTRCCGSCGWPRASARSSGVAPRRTARGPRGPTREVAAELRATAAAGVRARAQRRRSLLPLDRTALRRVAVLGPNAAVARTLGGGSATVFPRTPSRRSTACARALGGVEVTHAPGVTASERTPPSLARARSAPRAREVRFLDADGAELGSEQRHGGALRVAGRAREPAGRSVAAIEVRATLRAERARRARRRRARASGRFALDARRGAGARRRR